MINNGESARRLLEAVAQGSRDDAERLLHADARLRLWGWQGTEAHRPRNRVWDRLSSEWSAWTDASWEICTTTSEADRAVLEFRIQATEPGGRYVEHNRALVATFNEGCLHTLDLYCAEPVPTAPRHPLPAPADVSLPELHRMFELSRLGFDLREVVDANQSEYFSLRGGWGWGDQSHPGSNGVGGTRLTEAEAEAFIPAIIERFRARGAGFEWWVTPYDRPVDLPQRLEQHGLVRAGGYEKMVRKELADLSDIPVNPEVSVEVVDGRDEAALDAALNVIAVSFQMPPEGAVEFGRHWRERLQDQKFRDENLILLARVDGQAAGTARIVLRGWTGYLVAGSTLPEFRGRRVYSTLLRRRLEAARERGYAIVALDAGPMSRRIVERYGFKPHGTTHIYAWMPVIDMDVIRTLVPDQ